MRFWVCLYLAGVTACAPSSSVKSAPQLVGVWQAIPEIASGLHDTYRFYPDGRFVFSHNQMDCAEREISYAGRWTAPRDSLILSIEERRLLVGGHLEPALGSCASDSELVEATEQVTSAAGPQVQRLVLGPWRRVGVRRCCSHPARMDSVARIAIGGRYFWQIAADPAAYQ